MSSKSSENLADLSTVDVDNIALPFIRTAYDGSAVAASNKSALSFDPKIEPSLTKQSFVEECDINTILQNFAKTGLISHVNQSSPKFGLDLTLLPETYMESMNVVINAHENFLALPANIRDLFDNDPEKLLTFLADDKNYAEAVKLGLIDAPPAPVEPVGAPVPHPAGGDPQGAQNATGGASPASA